VNRITLECRGEAFGWRKGWAADSRLFLFPPERIEIKITQPKSAPTRAELARLRAEMIKSHPDKGGTPAGFIEARRRFLAAKKDGGRQMNASAGAAGRLAAISTGNS
jgi:hypothetical protein